MNRHALALLFGLATGIIVWIVAPYAGVAPW